MRWIVLALALGQAAHGTTRIKPDALAALEQNPSVSATERVGRIYRESRDPYARLWLVEALYTRVRLYQDEKALEILVEASRDKSPDVRRKAIAGLEAVRYLPADRQGPWMKRIDAIASGAGKDKASGVRSAGKDLQEARRNWSAPPSEHTPPPEGGSGEFSHWLFGAMPQVFVWVVGLQLIGYLWHRLGMGVLAKMGATGAAVTEAIAVFDKKPVLLAFPLMTGVLLLPTLGLSLAYALIGSFLPSSEPIGWLSVALFSVVIYALAGLACFLPALLMVGHLSSGKWATLKRLVGLIALAELALMLWPLEPLWRLFPKRRREGGVLGWLGRTGVPFASLLAGRLLIKERLGPWDALREASARFSAAGNEPGSELWGRAPFHPAFVLWSLASPVLFSLSLLPAVFLGFQPTQLFGIWFLSSVQFAVGFGWWAGALLSVSAFGQLMILGAINGAKLQEAKT